VLFVYNDIPIWLLKVNFVKRNICGLCQLNFFVLLLTVSRGVLKWHPTVVTKILPEQCPLKADSRLRDGVGQFEVGTGYSSFCRFSTLYRYFVVFLQYTAILGRQSDWKWHYLIHGNNGWYSCWQSQRLQWELI
jgi:hypothetical protein